MGKRCVFATIATIVAVAIALGVGLGLGLKSDDAAAGVFVYGETELTGFSSSEFNGNPNNALNFRRGVASLSSTVEYNDVTITSVTDVARRRAALRKILAVSSRVKIAFNVDGGGGGGAGARAAAAAPTSSRWSGAPQGWARLPGRPKRQGGGQQPFPSPPSTSPL